jgi:hypothetical protein
MHSSFRGDPNGAEHMDVRSNPAGEGRDESLPVGVR